MNIAEVLSQLGGTQSISRELGVTESQASAGVAALLPAILGGFSKQAGGKGIDGLSGVLASLGGSGLLDDVVGAQPTSVDKGNNVLGQIFGSKDVSRAVAQDASTKTGIDPAVLKKMLPIVAMLAAGYMAKQKSSGGGQAAQSAGGGLLGGLLGGLMGGKSAGPGGLASMLDMDGNGNPLDDILRIVGKK